MGRVSSALLREEQGEAGNLGMARNKRMKVMMNSHIGKNDKQRVVAKLFADVKRYEADIQEKIAWALDFIQNDRDEGVRTFWVEYLGEIGEWQDHRIMDVLVSVLDSDPAPGVRCAVLNALISYIDYDNPDERAIVTIRRHLESDPSPEVKKKAEETLALLRD
jgi:hypothetical protein